MKTGRQQLGEEVKKEEHKDKTEPKVTNSNPALFTMVNGKAYDDYQMYAREGISSWILSELIDEGEAEE